MDRIIKNQSSDNDSNLIKCLYINETEKVQITKIENIPNWYFERVVFPGQRLLFEAPSEAILGIFTGMMKSPTHVNSIPCESLKIEPDDVLEVENNNKRIILHIEVSDDAPSDMVALEVSNLCKAINAYHIACGGNGLAIDDWKALVLARQLVGV
jgi:Domain of unknown function (DUF1830)